MKRILIAGAGRMGSWFVSLLGKDYEVAVYDTNLVKQFSQSNILRINDIADAKHFRPDMLLNCVSINATISSFSEFLPYLPEDCLLVDIASVKDDIHSFYLNCQRRFVSIHPMFGPTFASFASLDGLNVIIINESDSFGKQFFRELFAPKGIEIYELSFQEHDNVVAETLSVPMIASMLFASGLEGRMPYGTSYQRMKDITEGYFSEDPGMISGILLNSYSREKIVGMIDFLQGIKSLVEDNNRHGADRLFFELREKYRASTTQEILTG